jgi:hypothetical protein
VNLNDYFRRLVEQTEQTPEERRAQEEGATAPDTLARVDFRLADYHRDRPSVLRSTVNGDVLEATDDVAERLDDLLVVRTELMVELEKADLHQRTVLFLARSLLVGTQHFLDEGREPPAPSRLLADVLRQERIARVMTPGEVGKGWRVIFEVESKRRRFDRAEDALFHALSLLNNDEALLRRGLDFYQQLLDLPARKLRRGGLSRKEADRAKWELLERLDGDA